MATPLFFNPALNVRAFPNFDKTPDVPPKNNAIYLRDGQYDGMSRNDVTNAFNAFESSPQTRLALFFHGGLVDKKSGTKAAAAEYDLYNGVCFPYFFVWEAGIWEVLGHHLPTIFASTIFTALFHSTTNQSAAKAGAPVTATTADLLFAANAPAAHPLNQPLTAAQRQAFQITEADIAKSVADVANDTMVQHAVADIARFNLSVPPDMHALMSRTPVVASSPNQHLNRALVGLITGAYRDSAKPSSALYADALFGFDLGGMVAAAWAFATHTVPTILHNVEERIARGRDHGIVCTVVEEILRAVYLASFGSNVWEEMKNETEDAFRDDSTKFGGTAVVEEICALVKAGTKKFDVTLVGHSTGAIYIGNFLEHIDAALIAIGDTKFQFDVVLMAAADTYAFQGHTYTKRIRALRSFGMTDAAEQDDLLMSKDVGTNPSASILGRVYPRSLLYLISGVLETYAPDIPSGAPHDLDTSDMPLIGMDRFFAKAALFTAADYSEVDAYRQLVANRSGSNLFMRVLSRTNNTTPGQQCTAEKHGNFPTDGFMIASLKYCFQNGLQ
jgi:hypothetical protein